MAIEDQLQDRYGAAATADDAKRLAQAVKTIFEKVEAEFGAQAGYIPAQG
jgi:membrane-bound lytic murein transglycosylase B